MKKKILLLVLCGIILFGLTGCGNDSQYKIVGIYSGNISAPSGYKDLFLIIDTNTDGKNIERISDTSRITLNIGENTYSIDENKFETSASASIQTYSKYSYFERATGCYYLNGEGTILGSNDNIRMFARFYINPNDLKSNNLELVIDNEKITYKFNNVEEINFIDEILKIENDYIESYNLASFIWRIDNAYQTANFTRRASGIYGSCCELISRSLSSQFDKNETGGLPFAEIRNYCPTDIDYFSSFEDELPAFDLNIILEKYSEFDDQITEYIEDVKKFAKCLNDPTTTDKKASELLSKLNEDYEKLCDSLKIEPISYY